MPRLYALLMTCCLLLPIVASAETGFDHFSRTDLELLPTKAASGDHQLNVRLSAFQKLGVLKSVERFGKTFYSIVDLGSFQTSSDEWTAFIAIRYVDNGKRLMAATMRKVLSWDVTSGELVEVWDTQFGTDSRIFDISENGNILCAIADQLQIVDLKNNVVVRKLEKSTLDIGFAEFSIDGRYVTGSGTKRDNKDLDLTCIWEAGSGKKNGCGQTQPPSYIEPAITVRGEMNARITNNWDTKYNSWSSDVLYSRVDSFRGKFITSGIFDQTTFYNPKGLKIPNLSLSASGNYLAADKVYNLGNGSYEPGLSARDGKTTHRFAPGDEDLIVLVNNERISINNIVDKGSFLHSSELTNSKLNLAQGETTDRFVLSPSLSRYAVVVRRDKSSRIIENRFSLPIADIRNFDKSFEMYEAGFKEEGIEAIRVAFMQNPYWLWSNQKSWRKITELNNFALTGEFLLASSDAALKDHNRSSVSLGVGVEGVSTRVKSVSEFTPAFVAGVKKGDVIQSIATMKTKTRGNLSSVLKKLKPGTSVPMVVERGGQIVQLTLALQRQHWYGASQLVDYGALACYTGHPAIAVKALDRINEWRDQNKIIGVKKGVWGFFALLEANILATLGKTDEAYKLLLKRDGAKEIASTFRNGALPYMTALYKDKKKLAYVLGVKESDLPRALPPIEPQDFVDLNGKLVKAAGSSAAVADADTPAPSTPKKETAPASGGTVKE